MQNTSYQQYVLSAPSRFLPLLGYNQHDEHASIHPHQPFQLTKTVAAHTLPFQFAAFTNVNNISMQFHAFFRKPWAWTRTRQQGLSVSKTVC